MSQGGSSGDTPRPHWWRALRLGILDGIVLMGATRLFAQVLGVEAPFETVADQVTRWLPAHIFSFVLFHLQHWAKPMLLLGLAAAWSGIGAVVALATLQSLWRGRVTRQRALYVAGIFPSVAMFLVSVLILSTLAGPGFAGSAGSSGALRSIVAVLLPTVLYGSLLYTQGRAPVTTSHVPPGTAQRAASPVAKSLTRRDFVLIAGSGAAAIGLLLLTRDVLRLSRGTAGVGGTPPPTPAGPGTDFEAGISPALTPAESFYVVSKNFSDPSIDASKWTLKIGGLVAKPLRLSYTDVTALPARQQHVTLECISNQVGGGLLSNALWTAVPLHIVIEQAAPQDGVEFVITRSEDGYTESLPVAVAMDPDVLLAYQMNGAPLLQQHGYPLRLLVPGRYGMKSAKWLAEINLAAKDSTGYWEQRGWDEMALVKTTSRFDVPRDGDSVPLGPVTLGGVAFAGARGIQRVELSSDNGATWIPGTLEPALSRYSWVRWKLRWQPPDKGTYRLQVRATDLAGMVQTSAPTSDFPSGATGYHTIGVRVT